MLRLRVTQRAPAAHEERRAGPQHHRRRQHQRNPVRPCGGTRCIRPRWRPISITNTGTVSASAIQNRLRHVDQFRIGRVVERDLLGLQRHAADRTACRDRPAAPRDASDRCRSCRPAPAGFGLARRSGIFGLGREAFAAARAAEEIFLALVGESDAWRSRGSTFMPQTGSIAARRCLSASPCWSAAAGVRPARRPMSRAMHESWPCAWP